LFFKVNQFVKGFFLHCFQSVIVLIFLITRKQVKKRENNIFGETILAKEEKKGVFHQKKKNTKQKTMLSIVTLNAFCSIPEPIRYNGMNARSKHFAEAFYSSVGEEIDIICFQELTWRRKEILENFTKHKYATPVMRASLFSDNVRLAESGLCVLSKYPLESIHATVFNGPNYHVERLCAKGALLVRIFIPNLGYVNVVNTHLNAWTGLKADKAREHQINQIANWILTLDIDPEEPLFFVGDFNVDAYEHSNTMDEIMVKLNATLHYPKTTSFSFDPASNPLVGLDAPLEYATLSRKGGCVNEYLTHGTCACCPRQLVDVISISKRNRQPEELKVEVVPVVHPTKFKIKVKMGVERSIQHVSDHSAVVMRLHFGIQNVIDPAGGQHCLKIGYDKPRFDWRWFLLQVTLTVFYTFLLLVIVYYCGVKRLKLWY
jgi:endonuclease/exonuclease/phosphatase family metal-dependent hydrolase